jgi:hypothetical protein
MPKHPASEANNLRAAIGRGQISAKVPAPRNSAERAFARGVRREPRPPPPPREPPEKGGLPLSVWLIVAAALAIAIVVLVFH